MTEIPDEVEGIIIRDNYKAACAKHVPSEDAEISEDEYTECQRVINAHSTLWTRILNAGEEVEGCKVHASDRIRNNFLVQNHSTAPYMSNVRTTM